MADIKLLSGKLRQGILYQETDRQSLLNTLSVFNDGIKDKLVRIYMFSDNKKIPYLFHRLEPGELIVMPSELVLKQGDSLISRVMSIGKERGRVKYALKILRCGEGASHAEKRPV